MEMLKNSSTTPKVLQFALLQKITDGFSEKQKVGNGGYGEVYKGKLDNGEEIAVKKLYQQPGLDHVQFKIELENLMRVRHQNIVQLVGYCYEIQHEIVEREGKPVFARREYRILCLEYLQNGSLDKHLCEEERGLDWCTRYKIIKGICEGLNYLHGLEKSIVHLDLKPENILLDENMVPKIADFGLSRLFGGTHITNNPAGTKMYMPPEYVNNGIITQKYDVFGLGVIIIQIMTGPKGYSKYWEMSPQQFIELVHQNWKVRVEATSMHTSAGEDCKQVKRCIEIALNCVKAEREERPTIGDIIHMLGETETMTHEVPMPFSQESASTSSSHFKTEMAALAKIGQWGGVGGGYNDIEVAPCRLKSLRICSGEVIYSLEFSYYDKNGNEHTAGPWGGEGPNRHGSDRGMIELGSSEFLTEVHGTIDPFYPAPAGVIKSLTFITNAGSYGPFGEVKGTPFQIPVRSNGSIVGFFARAGWYVDAFGIYVNPKQETEAGLAKMGPWGGNGGKAHDVKVAPRLLKSVTICSCIVVDSIAFSYNDHNGKQHTVGPWGGPGGSADTIQLGAREFLMGVYGTTGPFAQASSDVVTSLTLVTNARTYGPFGEGGGIPFQIPTWSNGSIVGFFGRAGSYVDAIGVYANPEQEAMGQEAGLTKIGPWGGKGGNPRNIDVHVEPHRLESVTIGFGAVVNSLAFSYIDLDGRKHTVGPWGSPGGHAYTLQLKPLEFLLEVSVSVGPFGVLPNVITSIMFNTNHCGYGPFGQGGGTMFSAPAERDGRIVGFFGRAGSCVEALGVYIHRY